MKNGTVTILEKGGVYGVFVIDKTTCNRFRVGRSDGTQQPPIKYRVWNTLDEGADCIKETFFLCRKRGWLVTYQGQRNYG